LFCCSSAYLVLRVPQHFFQFFKSLVGQEVIVELKNDMQLRGVLHSVDQYLNVKLSNLSVEEQEKHPHLVSNTAAAAAEDSKHRASEQQSRDEHKQADAAAGVRFCTGNRYAASIRSSSIVAAAPRCAAAVASAVCLCRRP